MKRAAHIAIADGHADPDRVLASLNLIQQAISIYDDDLRLVAANHKFADMFELPDALLREGACFGDTIRNLAERGEYGAGNIEEIVAERVALAAAFKPHYFERQRPCGKHISVEGHPLRKGGWVAVYTDITGFKRQEELLTARSESLHDEVTRRNRELVRANRELTATNTELSESQRQLAHSEARLRLVAEATPGHLAYVDDDRIYQYSNLRLDLGIMQVTDPVGLRMEQAIKPDIYRNMKPWIDRAYHGEALTRDYESTLSNGDFIALRTILTPHYSDTDQLLGLYILTLDITEERRAADRLLQSQKMEATATATSALAHDFANLLTIIMGLQGRLGRDETLPDDTRDLIKGIGVAAQRGASLIDQLSDVAGERAIAPEAVDLPAVIIQIADLYRHSSDQARAVSLSLDPALGWAMIDAGYLHDVVLNLLINASDATEMASAPQIDLSVRRDGKFIKISVDDNGSGFPAEAKERAFDPFYTTKGAGGAGLGLSTVYNFARMCGGTAAISRSSLGGASVALAIPYIAARQPSAKRAATDMVIAGIALVVDDEPEVRAAARDILRDLGWPVLEASSAAEAETLTRNIADIRLVLSDITMPDRDGLDLVRSIRAENPDLRLILMTGLPANTPIRRQAAGHFSVIQKPFNQDTLTNAINRDAP